MMQAKERLFEDPNRQYDQLKGQLYKNLSKDVAEEIEAFVQIKTTEKFDSLWKILNRRFERLNELYESDSENDSKEEQNKKIKRFFDLTNPKYVTDELKVIIEFDEIEKDFKAVIDTLAKGEHGKLFLRYKFDSNLFGFLKHGLLVELKNLASKLEVYTEQIGQHVILLQEINDSKKTKGAIKGGLTALSLIVGVPFLGTAAGKLMGANDEAKQTDSLKKVFGKWDDYTDQLRVFLEDLEYRYRHILMTLYGGTLLRVNEQFRSFHLELEWLNLKTNDYGLCLTEEEIKRVKNWVNETTSGMDELLATNKVKEALHVSNRFFHFVSDNPIMSRTVVQREKSVMYLANLYKYAALTKKVEELDAEKGNELIVEIYRQLPLFVHDADLESIKITTQTKMLSKLIHRCLEDKNEDQLVIFLEYFQRMVKRGERENIYIGEDGRKADESFVIFYLLSVFVEEVLKKESPTSGFFKDYFVKYKYVRKLRKYYVENCGIDKFSKMLGQAQFISGTMTLFSPIIKPFVRYTKRSIAIMLLIVLATVGYVQKDAIVEKTSAFFTNDKDEEVTSEPVVRYVKLMVDQANVRMSPNLDAKIIAVLELGTSMEYLETEQKDADGRTWYKVGLPDGNVGWISSKIVEME